MQRVLLEQDEDTRALFVRLVMPGSQADKAGTILYMIVRARAREQNLAVPWSMAAEYA